MSKNPFDWKDPRVQVSAIEIIRKHGLEVLFDERELSEIKLAQVYAQEFQHGTDGHNRLMLIDKLVFIAQRMEHELIKQSGD